jgi:aldehyde dehydrogenase (NAD+)
MSDTTAPRDDVVAGNGHAATAAAPERAPLRWDYSPAPESTDHVRLRDRYGLFIGGEFVDADAYAPTINPATEEPLAEVAQASAADVERAVAAARAAAPAWAALPGLERGKYVFRIARLIQERARELAVVETMDGGKPIKESRDVDVPLAAAHFFYYAGWADKLAYGVPVGVGQRVAPRGVVGQVIPWNFPLLMAAWKLAPALATGNTAVLKPADTTPLTALLLAEILQEAELPDGVVNIVTGDGSAGAALVRGDVDKVAFTGSTAVGREIQAALAGRDVGLTLELGGKSANIVFEDASLDQAVEGIVQGIFFNQGHVCCAGSRLLVQESVASQAVGRLWARMQNLRVGDPLDKNTDVGAINSRAQLDRIGELVSAGVEEGAGLRQLSCDLPARGYWFAPALFTEASPAHRVSREEIFGPVLTVSTFRTHAEAVEKANNSAYGLAAGIWTDKGSKAFEVASQLRSGVVWQNTYNHFDPTAAFGGFKESGFGREGGPSGLRPYVKVLGA